jgi:lysozyme
MTYLQGIDVFYQYGEINWGAVKKAGVQYAIIKATEGITLQDSKFAENYKNAKAAGLIVGAYHFFHPKDDIHAQLNNFFNVATVSDGDLPPAVDLENPNEWTTLSLAQRTGCITQFLSGVEQKYAIRPMVYLGPSFAHEILQDSKSLSQYPLWLCHYTSDPAPQLPPAWSAWTIWQYSDNGTVPGINHKCDMNRFAGSLVDLQRLAKGAAVQTGSP